MSTNDPLIGPRVRTILLLSTHAALLVVILVPAVPFDFRTAVLLVSIEGALLGKQVYQQIAGQSVTISFGDDSDGGGAGGSGGRDGGEDDGGEDGR